MKCENCGEMLRYTGCTAPTCTSYGCETCDRGCDLPFKTETLSRCANSIINTRIEAWTPTPIGDVIAPMAGLLGKVALAERTPIARTGQRERISREVRSGVYMRDRGRCAICGQWAQGGELDHVIPWSAGGSDRSDNLRVTCGPCNQRRSNFHHLVDAQAMTPVATTCQLCSHQEPYIGSGAKLAVFCMCCRRNSTSFAANTI